MSSQQGKHNVRGMLQKYGSMQIPIAISTSRSATAPLPLLQVLMQAGPCVQWPQLQCKHKLLTHHHNLQYMQVAHHTGLSIRHACTAQAGDGVYGPGKVDFEMKRSLSSTPCMITTRSSHSHHPSCAHTADCRQVAYRRLMMYAHPTPLAVLHAKLHAI